MIKLLKKYEVLTTPFEAVKTWAINNTHNENLLLYESTGSDDGIPYALEFIDFGSGTPFTSSTCDIALEQQDSDRATLELGLNVVGIFYPELDPQNLDGTYKRSVYHQVKTMFYNMYYDPTKVWGIENIDFPLSRTERRLSDEIRLLNIPRDVFGDKIVPKTVLVTDNTTDNDYTITDDGYGNLLAGTNVFLRQQVLGEFQNVFTSGYSTYCDSYFGSLNVTSPQNVVTYLTHTASFSVVVTGLGPFTYQWFSGSTLLTDNSRLTGSNTTFLQINNAQFSDAGNYRIHVNNPYGSSVYSSYASLTVLDNVIVTSGSDSLIVDPTLLYGSLFERPPYVEDSIPVLGYISLLTGSVIDMVVQIYGGNETSSVNVGFNSGYIFDVIKTIYGGNETTSVRTGFYAGNIFNVLTPIYGGNETSSINVGFYSGSLTISVKPMYDSDEISSITVGLLTGSCQ